MGTGGKLLLILTRCTVQTALYTLCKLIHSATFSSLKKLDNKNYTHDQVIKQSIIFLRVQHSFAFLYLHW